MKEEIWKPTKAENPNFRCQCGSNEIMYNLWESPCGGFEDYHYKCECGKDWWVESADS